MAALNGAVTAQFVLLSVWWAWSSGSIAIRSSIVVLISLLLFAIWLAGLPFGVPLDVVMQSFISASLILSFVFFPLWCLRMAFGFAILRQDAPLDAYPDRRVSLSDLFAATLAVAVFLSIARQHSSVRDGFVIFPSVIAIVLSSLSIAVIVPLAACVLTNSCNRPRYGFAAGYVALLIGLVNLLYFTMTSSFASRHQFILWIAMQAFLISLFLLTILPLIWSRSAGYRLVTAWDRERLKKQLKDAEKSIV